MLMSHAVETLHMRRTVSVLSFEMDGDFIPRQEFQPGKSIAGSSIRCNFNFETNCNRKRLLSNLDT